MSLDRILFLDLEPFNLDRKQNRIREIGVVIGEFTFKESSPQKLANLLKPFAPKYLCGHNLRTFDLSYLNESALLTTVENLSVIDTLELSLLLFSENTIHKLPKVYKENDPDMISDPLEDAHITKQLLVKIIERYRELPESLQEIYTTLLSNTKKFKPFFDIIGVRTESAYIPSQLTQKLLKEFPNKIKSPDNLLTLIKEKPIELAYIISILHDTIELKSFPLKIFKDYPGIQELLNSITFNKNEAIKNLGTDAEKYFGFPGFRSFPKQMDTGLFNEQEQLSQREIVQAALEDEDLLSVLPTGGGKTFSFWLPAIIKAKSTRGLTVVISPLQALMKDHIFNFNKNLSGMASAEALSGYLTLPERRSIINKVINGSIDILYLAPESLRSKNIERILSYRYIERIVVDEAHCLSTWGNDFRHDYFYIAQFIQKLLDKKYNQGRIPISCFTATANKKTIEDIESYFNEYLGIKFNHYIASPKRTNLTFHATHHENKQEKSTSLLEKVRHFKEPLLIYNPSSRKQCEMIATQLQDTLNRPFKAFHAGMSNSDKQTVLDDYIGDNVDGIVATTAFGMGIDKPNIKHVLHYEPSSSLEDYMQEAGRAGRDGKLANCYVLYKDDDFDKLFFSLIRQKVTQSEIKKIFQEIKRYKGKVTSGEKRVVVSIQELASRAGIAVDDETTDYDTKIKTAILELERSDYVRRGYNKPNVYVTAFHFQSMEELREKLAKHDLSENDKDQKKSAIFKSSILVGQILMKKSTQRFSMKIEELANLLNIDMDELYRVLDKMREMDLVSLKEDIVISDLFVNKLHALLKELPKLKKSLLQALNDVSHERFKLKDLNQSLQNNHSKITFSNYDNVLIYLLNNIKKRGVFEFYRMRVNDQHWHCKIIEAKILEKRNIEFIDTIITVAEYLLNHYNNNQKEKRITIPYHTMVNDCNNTLGRKVPIATYDKAVLFLHQIRLIRLEGGRVLHHMRLELFINDSLSAYKQYTKEDYKIRMAPMYERKRAAIHIMNHYIELLTSRPNIAQEFSTDYFTMEFDPFVKKYKLSRKLKLPVSQSRYNRLKDGLTDEQKQIIFDDESQTMLILAGPGTGKTMVMVNKIAHMILDEDYKPEHFLMLTFTRTAAHEFKQRLFDLLGDLAYNIDIYTFHAYATELAGITFNNTQKDTAAFNEIIPQVTQKLNCGDITLPFKNAIILDEFQDTNNEAFEFIVSLYKQFAQMKGNEKANDVRIIAVGDDDQCIMEMTNGANIEFMRKFVDSFNEAGKDKRKWYRLTQNFRSQSSIVKSCNQFVSKIQNRIDPNKQIVPAGDKAGNVYLTYYQSPNFLEVLFATIKNSESKSIAILTHENDQVLDIYSILKQDTTLEVSFLLKNEGFHLNMLDEIHSFTHYLINNLNTNEKIISQNLFDDAKKYIRKEFANSTNLILTLQHIYEFEAEHELLTLSFWENYTYETFVGVLKNTKSRIVVSTIHRAKGKEWDEVHVVLQKEHNMNNPDYFQRLYYVALTRAKSILHIHAYPQTPFKILEDQKITINSNQVVQSNKQKRRILIMQLEDANLSFLAWEKASQSFLEKNKVLAGSPVTLKQFQYTYNGSQMSGYKIIYDDIAIGRLSNAFIKKLDSNLSKGYKIEEVTIEYVAKWFDKKQEILCDIFLCRVTLKTL